MTIPSDRYETNEMYAAERDESRSARRGVSELQRVSTCWHDYQRTRGGAVCLYCGDFMGSDEL